jgi:uncharacterized protein (UPF0276 family)
VPHYPRLWERADAGVDFFEVILENFLGPCAPAQRNLLRARELAPIVLHGVSLSLLGPGPLDREHLRQIKALADRLDAPYVTDHLCWSSAHGQFTHDLLPVPMTPALARYGARRAREVQDFLERPFGLENLSAMASLAGSSQPEWAFWRDVVEEAGCGYLLDVNNVYVSSVNTGTPAGEYLDALDPAKILQVHVAGHRRVEGGPIVDTHDRPVPAEVWALYRRAWQQLGPFPTLLEWDAELPPYEEALAELAQARHARAGVIPAPRQRPPAGPPLEAPAAEEPPEDATRWQQGLLALVSTPLAWEPPHARARVEVYPDDVVQAVVSDELPAPERLRAYHEQYWFRLLSTLQGLYPTLSRLMGLWRFNELCSAWLAAHPPRQRDLGAVGDGLPAFLPGTPWAEPAWLEAARYDLLWTHLFQLPPVAPWTPAPQDLADIARRHLPLSPTLARLTLHWPMPLLRDAALALQGESSLPLPDPDPGPWLVFRTPTLEMTRLRPDPALMLLLEHLETLPLGEALAEVHATYGERDRGLQGKVQGWFAAGVRWGWFAG